MGRCPSPIDDPEVEGYGERCVGCPTCRTGELQRLGIQVSQHDYVLAASPDEEVARDFLLFGRPDVTLAVVDATRLERNLNLILQILEITARVVVGLNLIDQARRCGLEIDDRRLARDLGVPVVRMAARYREGLDSLLQAVNDVATGALACRGYRFRGEPPELKRSIDTLVERLERAFPGLPNARWVALRLLDGDERIMAAVRNGELHTPRTNGTPTETGTMRSSAVQVVP